MKCPTCRRTDLAPVKLADELPALGCSECEGALVSLLYYRDWAERTHHPQHEGEPEPKVNATETPTALTCPKCSRLMSKFRISGKQHNRVDLCAGCDEAWLDGGEWELLQELNLRARLPEIFTPHWQKRVRDEATEQARQERFSRIFGEDFERIQAFREWLNTHPEREQILFYLNLS